MLAIFNQHPHVDEISIDTSNENLRQHIAKILAKISASKSVQTDISQECFEAELS